MIELAELRQRVEAAGESLGEAAAENQKLHERLLGLLSVVEECFAHSQHKIESLSEELARTNEEKQQLQAMLQTLLAETEGDSVRAIGATRRELEARINSLVEAASSISGTLGEGATKLTMGSVVTVNTIEDDGTTAGPTDTEPVIRPSEAVSEETLTDVEEVKGEPGHEAKEEAKSDLTIAELSNLYVAQGCTAEKPTTLVTDEARTPRSKLLQRVQAGTDVGETSSMSPVSGEEATQEREPPGTEDGEEKMPLELTQMVAEDGAVVDLNDDQGQPAEKDRATVQEIIKRVSLLTGTLRQEQVSTSPDPDAAPEEDKKIESAK
jgi:antitoxin (DNA-binding transcriptional repressor) of toxin-antitoxin stability system